jgi:adenylate cyclase
LLFADILKAPPADRPAQLYLERCGIYRKNPPPENWDGVWTLQVQ